MNEAKTALGLKGQIITEERSHLSENQGVTGIKVRGCHS